MLVARPEIAGIEEHPTRADAEEIRDGRGRPAHVEVLAARTVHAQHALVHVSAHHGIPVAVVGGVDRVLARVWRIVTRGAVSTNRRVDGSSV